MKIIGYLTTLYLMKSVPRPRSTPLGCGLNGSPIIIPSNYTASVSQSFNVSPQLRRTGVVVQPRNYEVVNENEFRLL